jgi:hypothetical protein
MKPKTTLKPERSSRRHGQPATSPPPVKRYLGNTQKTRNRKMTEFQKNLPPARFQGAFDPDHGLKQVVL